MMVKDTAPMLTMSNVTRADSITGRAYPSLTRRDLITSFGAYERFGLTQTWRSTPRDSIHRTR